MIQQQVWFVAQLYFEMQRTQIKDINLLHGWSGVFITAGMAVDDTMQYILHADVSIPNLALKVWQQVWVHFF